MTSRRRVHALCVHRSAARGVSLVEALVALAVLAFGMLGVIGMQASLRVAADTARQNAEAVRIAQASIEDARAFANIATGGGVAAYADIADIAPTPVAGLASNTTFTLTRTVTDSPDPRTRTLTVDVTWEDRTGQAQRVRLATSIAGIAPALAAATGVPAEGGPTVLPRGRHRGIPSDAVLIDSRTSRFTPPGGGTVSWIFDNLTGVITSLCSAPGVCVGTTAYLLAGYVNFATDAAQPTAADAEVPPSPATPLGVQVVQTAPTAGTVLCYTRLRPSVVEYYCAVEVTTATPLWSGRAELVGPPLAASIADPDDTRQRVCRYTPVRGCQPAVGSTIWGAAGAVASCTGSAPTPSRTMRNADHPLDYVGVTGSLTNQNFLLIRAGDGTTAFDCPDDDPATPLVNGNTWHHQPSS